VQLPVLWSRRLATTPAVAPSFFASADLSKNRPELPAKRRGEGAKINEYRQLGYG